jgi:hypothetical protein
MSFEQGERVQINHFVSISQNSINIHLPGEGRSILIKVQFKETEEGVTEIVLQNCEIY